MKKKPTVKYCVEYIPGVTVKKVLIKMIKVGGRWDNFPIKATMYDVETTYWKEEGYRLYNQPRTYYRSKKAAMAAFIEYCLSEGL